MRISELPTKQKLEIIMNMKKVFKVSQIRGLLNHVHSEKITFSRFVEILNENANKKTFDINIVEQKNCTCNSRTVDENFDNVIHSVDCELSAKTPQKDKLDELIEWMESEYNELEKLDKIRGLTEFGMGRFSELERILTKAKEIKQQP